MHDIAPPRPSKPRNPTRNTRTSAATALEMSAGRVRDIAALRGLGFSYREIADHFKVSPQAISILLERNRRNIETVGGTPAMAGLSTRASTALRRLGIDDPEQARGRDVLGQLQSARNCGTKTLNEIADWLSANGAARPTQTAA